MKNVAQTIGWSGIVLAILVALNQALSWGGSWQYLWALLMLGVGIWTLTLKA